MEAEARYTYVGLAVLLLVAALAASLLWLQNVGARERFVHYAIHFERQALDGLEVGANVKLRGIKVGRVEDYALSDDAFGRVRVEVRVDRRVPVTTHTVAVITRNYVTGLAVVNLVNRDAGGDALVAGVADALPVIAEGRSDIDLITGRLGEVGELASDVLDNLNRLLAAENRDALTDAVRGVRDLAAGLNARLGVLENTLARVGTAASDIGGATTRLADASERLAGAGEAAGARIADAVEQAAVQIAGSAGAAGERFDRTLTQADATLTDARGALVQVSQAVAAIERQTLASMRRLEDSAANVDDQIAGAVAELRLAVDAATQVFDRLRDPRAALLGPVPSQLGPGEAAR